MKLHLPQVPFDVHLSPLPDGPRQERRQREEATLYTLLHEIFGPTAERRHSPTGAPVLFIDGQEADTRISISHSPHWLALGIAPQHIHAGIDIEEWTPRLPRLLPHILSEQEMAATPHSEPIHYLRSWTLKEATYKACRDQLPQAPEYRRHILLPLNGRSAGAEMGQTRVECRHYCTEIEPDTFIACVWHQ